MGFMRKSASQMFAVILAIGAITTGSLGQSDLLDTKVKNEVVDSVSTLLSDRAFVPGIDFKKWSDFLNQEKSQIDTAKSDDDFQKAINAALQKFGASHVMLMTPRLARIRRTGSTVGIGISTLPVADGLSVVRVVPSAPADKAGIQAGDVITQVDGKPITNTQGITGEVGTEVLIKAKHQDGKIQDYKLIRQKYSTVREPELNWVNKETAQIKIYSFDTGYERSQVGDLFTQAQSAKNIILDLRFNGGGAVTNVQHLLGFFIPDTKAIGTFIRRSNVDAYVLATGGKPNDLAAIAQWTENKFRPVHRSDLPLFNGHVAVLVNRFSASASEIAAAALHDTLGAPIIGTKSAGAVLASIIVPASNGFMLQYPIQDYVTSKGVRLEGNGVVPDFEVKEPIASPKGAPDEAIEKACSVLAHTKSVK